MSNAYEILTAFEEALELERELGTRTVELDRALLRNPAPAVPPAAQVQQSPSVESPTPATSVAASRVQAETPPTAQSIPDFAFLLECEPSGQVAELLPKMSEAIGYGRDGVRVNDPNARVLIVLGADALRKWLPGVLARPGQWVKRGETPALVTASPTKTYRFFGNDPDKIHKLKLRLWADLKAALARIGKTPPARQNGKR